MGSTWRKERHGLFCLRGGELAMVRQIVIEAETPGDSRTMFRLRIDASAIAEGLTAVQAHVLVGEILERIAVPRSPGDPETVTAPDAATTPRRRLAQG
jgi:hypothetical protein